MTHYMFLFKDADIMEIRKCDRQTYGPIAIMMKSSEISNENVSCGHIALKMDNMDMLANILRLLSGRSGEDGLDLHFFWHAGDHH